MIERIIILLGSCTDKNNAQYRGVFAIARGQRMTNHCASNTDYAFIMAS
jgi:hypothetical protein